MLGDGHNILEQLEAVTDDSPEEVREGDADDIFAPIKKKMTQQEIMQMINGWERL